jgi:hypothetical protein
MHSVTFVQEAPRATRAASHQRLPSAGSGFPSARMTNGGSAMVKSTPLLRAAFAGGSSSSTVSALLLFCIWHEA